jgi:hypothetical protein
MGIPQDWAPYSTVDEAARISAIKSFIMSRGFTEESWGEALWQEVVLTDGRRLIMWRADDEMSTPADHEPRRVLAASVRSILLSTITDQVLTTE